MTDLFTDLTTRMTRDSNCLNLELNPTLVRCQDISSLRYVLINYAELPRTIVRLLINVRNTARQQNYKDIDSELTRNIGEELGTETGGIPHFDLLAQALKQEVDIDISHRCGTTAKNSSPATHAFLETLNSLTASTHIGMAFGAAYALEASAVAELKVVLRLIVRLRALLRGDGPLGPVAKEFFRLHLNVWEPGHAQGLVHTGKSLVERGETETAQLFEQSFLETIKAMEIWWQALADEARQ